MATETVSNKVSSAETTALRPTDFAQAVLAPLASLKLTVCLLALSVLVVFIATLEQTRADVFTVKMRHFQNLFVDVPFQTFFVPAWFPNLQNVPGRFYIPSGLTVLVLMLMNLTAAHMLRFRLQAKGTRLILGIVVAIFAGFLTWAVIFNGQDANGFQSAPPLSWTQMWMMLQIGLLGLGIAAAVSFLSINKSRKTERLVLALSAVISIGLLGVTLFLGEKAFIGDSAMRILWQLIQSTIAALVAYMACMMLFKRKAGIVLLHLGIAGLMLNEIYVTVTNEEQRMSIIEGQTVSQAVDIRGTEMAIIDVSDPEFDEIVTVPGNKLQSGEHISSNELPFDIHCLKYLPNSSVSRIGPEMAGENLATKGIGTAYQAIDLPPSAGTDADQAVDFASAYVELKDKQTGDSLGTYLISQHIEEAESDSVVIDGKSYSIALRFRTAYKPYSVTLVDAQRENYIGTDTPRWYSSDVILNDQENGIKSDQRVWMNNPLRYSGETFYQSGMDTLIDGREYTVLQVVRNHGWMIPYVCCMFTVVGLIAQFGSTLLGFLEKNQAKQARERSLPPTPIPAAELANVKPRKPVKTTAERTPNIVSTTGSRWDWVPTLVLVGFFGIWSANELAKASYGTVTHNDMRLDLLGQIPVTINGRVQPLDSFARNTARQLSKRETVFDKNDDKQPAIRWLADTVFEVDGYDQYRVFRIEDLNILGALELPAAFSKPRDKFRYTLAELTKAEPKLRKLIPNSQEKDPKTWTEFQKRLNGVSTKMQRLFGLKLAFGGPDRTSEDLLIRIETVGRSVASPLIPRIVPNQDPEKPWVSMMSVWLDDLAEKYNTNTTNELAKTIINAEILPSLREDTIRARIIQRYLSDPGFLEFTAKEYGEQDPRVLAQLMEENWDKFPENLKSELVAAEGPMVDALIDQQMPRYIDVMEKQLAAINGMKGEISNGDPELTNLLKQLGPAYVDQDAETFNSTLENYLAKVRANPPKGMSEFKLATEGFYNSFSPFHTASIIYLASFLVAMFGWVGLQKGWHRAAYGLLLLALTIQIVGLVLRVIISGRPPVTNLYSSVLFVSATMVGLMLIVERMTKIGIGSVTAGQGAFLALLWAWTMSIVDGDTFTVMVAVLDTQFWLATHVVCISIGYAATFGAGLLGLAFIIGSLLSPAMKTKEKRRTFSNVIYGVVCFGLLCSFFGTVLGGLWGDDSWGRFWGWDPKENGALMIVLWNAVVLHARWGGLVRERGLAALAALGNVVVLWSWKGVNAMGVGLHAYAGTEDEDTIRKIMMVAALHILVAALVIIPSRFWMSYAKQDSDRRLQA